MGVFRGQQVICVLYFKEFPVCKFSSGFREGNGKKKKKKGKVRGKVNSAPTDLDETLHSVPADGACELRVRCLAVRYVGGMHNQPHCRSARPDWSGSSSPSARI